MIPAKYQPDQKPLSSVVSTLDRIFRPDPVVPREMMELLRRLEATPALIASATRAAPTVTHP